MFLMYDSTEPNQVPNHPHAVAYYVDGHFGVITHEEARARWPHARLLPISTGSGVACECYDIERGDYKSSDAPHLFEVATKDGLERPCFYANLSTMPAVIEALHTAGIPRDRIRLWVASWDGVSVIPGGYDAKQFTDKALERNLDESICKDNFFAPLVIPDKVLRANIAYDENTGRWTVAPA